MKRALALLVIGSAVLGMTGTAMASPGNDDFADATTITQLPLSDSVDIRNATTEDGEPFSSCARNEQHTVWYVTAPTVDESLLFDMSNSSFLPYFTFYVGSDLSSLTEVACKTWSYDFNTGEPTLRFRVDLKAGQTYHVQASGYSSNAGRLAFTVTGGPSEQQVSHDSQRYVLANGAVTGPCDPSVPETGGVCFSLPEATQRFLSLSIVDDVSPQVDALYQLSDANGFLLGGGTFCSSVENLSIPDEAAHMRVWIGPVVQVVASGCATPQPATDGEVSLDMTGTTFTS